MAIDQRFLDMSAKLVARQDRDIDADAVVAAFHRWIREDILDEQLLIDVGDYRHVWNGPGVVLACHRGLLSFGAHGGRPGLRFERKGASRAEADTLFRSALRTVGAACLLLSDEEGLRDVLSFDAGRVEVRIEDRLRAPRRTSTLVRLRERVEPTVATLFAGASRIDIEPVTDAAAGFGLDLRITDGPALDVIVERARSAA